MQEEKRKTEMDLLKNGTVLQKINVDRKSAFLKMFETRKATLRIELLQFLKLAELVKLSLVCKRLHNIIDCNKDILDNAKNETAPTSNPKGLSTHLAVFAYQVVQTRILEHQEIQRLDKEALKLVIQKLSEYNNG